MTITRRTLAQSVTFTGVGLHTGEPVTLTIHPADDGIAFRYGAERTPAWVKNVTDTTRSTKVGSVGTVEHLMSALAGLEITDAECEFSYPEAPGLDGSSGPYVTALLQTGLVTLGEREIPDLYQRAFLQEGDVKIAASRGHGHWRFTYDVGARWPHAQSYEAEDVVAAYANQIAPSRTFALSEEVPFIIQHGLARGLNEESAVIVGVEGYENEARFDDEPARHKLLDIMGDLYLSGVPVRMLNVVAEKSGHRTNVKAAALIAQGVWGRE